MKAFIWNTQFETGLAEIDEQHKMLVNIINKLGSLVSRDDLNLDNSNEIFDELYNYTAYHFKSEESLMTEKVLNNDLLENHKQKHLDFLNLLIEIHTSFTYNNADSVGMLFNFLVNWLSYHILGEDQNMAGIIRASDKEAPLVEIQNDEKNNSIKNISIEPLLSALNNMFLQVSRKNKELKLLNNTLESKVDERTQELIKANKKLEELALTDALTGLSNRRYAIISLEKMWGEAKKNKTSIACILIDADHFKVVNDNFGHDAGDIVLKELSWTISHSVRNDDIVSRLGGDEFLILCPKTNLEGAIYVAENILKAVNELDVQLKEGHWKSSVSIGVAVDSDNTSKYEELLKEADMAVYRAKNSGKNCVKT